MSRPTPRPLGRLALGCLVALLGLVPAAGAAADGDDARPVPLESRIYDVRALVQMHGEFGPEPGPFTLGQDAAPKCIAEAPPPGTETEEFQRPFGDILDLIGRLRETLGPAALWTSDGVGIGNVGGGPLLYIQARSELQQRVSEFLLQAEREAFTTVTVDVVALSGDVSESGFADAIGRGALRPIASARASGLLNQSATAFQGGQQAFVVDQKVVVAKDAKATDPIVATPRDGISLLFRASRAAEKVDVAIDAWLARVTPTAPRESEGERVEVPDVDGRQVHGTYRLTPGAWTLVASAGGVSFAARATVRTFEDPRAWPPSLRVEGPLAGSPVGPLRLERMSVGDIAVRAVNARGTTILIPPSNYTSPEPPELHEPMPAFPPDALVETIRGTIDPPSWQSEGASMDLKGVTLIARNDDARLAAIRRMLDGLRERCLKEVRVRARVVTVTASSLADGWAGGALPSAGGIEEAAAVLALPGARVVDRGSLQVLPGTRQAYVGGAQRSYIADYDPEIAEKASIGNPIVRTFLEGISLDVQPVRVLGGGAYVCEVRFDRGTWRGSRQVPSRHGDIECPSVGLTRFRGTLVANVGETRVLAAGSDDGEATFVLLTLTED